MRRAAVDETLDPWAWARQSRAAEAPVDVSNATVTAVVVSHNGEQWVEPMLDSLDALTISPTRLILVDAGSTDSTPDLLSEALSDGFADEVVSAPAGATFGAAVQAALAVEGEPCQWLWLLHDDIEADPACLQRLLETGLGPDAPDAVTPLLVRPRRRGAAAQIAELGQTVTHAGVITSPVAPGALDQGQLETARVLGANVCGLLVRREVWDALGGLDVSVATAAQGIEFGWRATASGRTVTAEPSARLTHWEASVRDIRDGGEPEPMLQRRRWGMALDEAFRASRFGVRQRAIVRNAAWGRMAVHLLGKDLATVGSEARALHGWRRDRAAVKRLRERFVAAVGEARPARIGGLRPTARETRARAFDELGARVSAWAGQFTDRPEDGGLDTLTGDDFAGGDMRAHGPKPFVLVLVGMVLAALAASRHLFGLAPLSGPQLLSAHPSLDRLLADYLAPVAGAPGVAAPSWLGVAPSAGPPWLGLGWLAALPTFGHPDLIVSLVLLGAVPLSFLLARRVLRRLVTERGIAVVGASLYALAPVVTGAVGSGQVGTVTWSLLLLVLLNACVTWYREQDPPWQVLGVVALTTTAMTALVPVTWPIVVVAAVVLGVRGRTRWPKVLFASLAPAILLVTPWTLQWLAMPGRLLTGIDPVLAPVAAAPQWWELASGRPAVAALPPLWLSVAVLGTLWLLALAGLLRRPSRAGWGVVVAGMALLGSVAATRFVVAVPPHGEARPQASALIILMVAGLIGAAGLGVDGLASAVGRRSFGPAHLATYAIGLVAGLATLLAGGWWVAEGHAPLRRVEGNGPPAFIRQEMQRGAIRTLALELDGRTVRWAMQEDEQGHLGQTERGLVLGGEPDSLALAGSVAGRIAAGGGDDRIVPDLQRLGVGAVWASGTSPELRVSIGNTPGLGTGTGDDRSANWPVPGSGRIVLADAAGPVRLAPGDAIAPGPEGRTLVLADPPDDRWWAAVNGVRLPVVKPDGGRPTFLAPANGGVLTTGLDAPHPWWAWVQLGGLIVLLLLAAPAIRTVRPEVPARTRPRRARKARR